MADKLAAQQQIQLSSYQAGLNVNLHTLILFVYPHNMVHNSLIYYIAMGLSKLDSRKPQVCFQQVLRNNVKDQICATNALAGEEISSVFCDDKFVRE